MTNDNIVGNDEWLLAVDTGAWQGSCVGLRISSPNSQRREKASRCDSEDGSAEETRVEPPLGFRFVVALKGLCDKAFESRSG